MKEGEYLRSIEKSWLSTAALRVTHESSSSQAVSEQMARFFEALVRALESGEATCLDPVLTDWCDAQPESDLDGQPNSVIAILKEVMTLTGDVCQERLDPADTCRVNAALIPIFAYAFEKASQETIETRVALAASRLDSIRYDLERLARSKSDFISVAAHELKTPLTLIEGYTAMLRDALGEQAQAEVEATLLRGIAQGSQRLQTIIDDMIDVSLIDNRMLSLNFQPVWLDQIFKQLANELNDQLGERRLTLTLGPLDGCREKTFADPARLTQAFRHVLTNAVKFTPDGGKVVVGGRRLPGFIEVWVGDTGIGIDPKDQVLIFEKFSRLGNPALHSSGKTKFKGGGPGLGLHITRGIMEAHGGSVWVESSGHDEETCPGSTFHFLIPHRTKPPDPLTARLFDSTSSLSQIS